MKKFEGDLILSDLDGTLTYKEGLISQQNQDALNYFMQNGGLFAYCTGRLCGYVDVFPLKANAPCVTHNGALIKQGERTIFSNPFDFDVYEIINDIIENNQGITHVRCCTENNIYVHPEKASKSESIYKYLFVSDTEQNGEKLINYVRQKHQSCLEIFRSWNCGIEILNKGSTKGNCAKILKKELNIKNLYCIGDYENDISMLKVADLSFAPQNGFSKAKEIADIITPANTQNAVKYMVDYLDKLKSTD